MPNIRIHLGLVCVGVCLALTAGCSARNGLFTSFMGGSDKRENVPVTKIVAVWEASEGRDMKGSPCRGMAGQISFYKPGQAAPVPVDGKVSIYVFDDQGKREEQGKPLHKFVFDSKAWSRHLRDTQLGPTYHVFIPYTRKVVNQVEAAVAVRFVPTKPNAPGAASDMVALTLPGPKRSVDGRLKIETTSLGPKRKIDVATFKPGEYLSGTKGAPSATSVDTRSAAAPRTSAKFHDFDLAPRTQVRSLGPARQPLAAQPPSADDIRNRQNAQLRSLLADFDKNSANRTPPADAPRSFRMTPAPQDVLDRGVTTAGHEQHPGPISAANERHPLTAGPSAPGPQSIRQSAHSQPGGDPFLNRAPANRTSTHSLLDGDRGDFSSRRPPRRRHPLVDEQAAWGEN